MALRSWLRIGYPKELATTRRQEAMMRPQLVNRPTDTRQTDMRQRDPQASIYVVWLQNRVIYTWLYLASYNKARGHDETPARQQIHRHEVMRPKATDLQSQKLIVVVSRGRGT